MRLLDFASRVHERLPSSAPITTPSPSEIAKTVIGPESFVGPNKHGVARFEIYCGHSAKTIFVIGGHFTENGLGGMLFVF